MHLHRLQTGSMAAASRRRGSQEARMGPSPRRHGSGKPETALCKPTSRGEMEQRPSETSKATNDSSVAAAALTAGGLVTPRACNLKLMLRGPRTTNLPTPPPARRPITTLEGDKQLPGAEAGYQSRQAGPMPDTWRWI